MTEEKDVAADTNGEEKKEENVEDSDKETELDSAIIRQVEFYFGDSNLPRDRFLQNQIQLDEGWVPLEILTRFNRLSKLSKDTDVIAKALAKSTSGLLEISDDNKKVRRNPELPIPQMNEDHRKEIMSRTVYAKGFPKDSALDDILQFFKQYEEVINVVMRRYQDRNTMKWNFKGSVFATFKTREQAEKFLSKPVKYQNGDLLTLWQVDYNKSKQEEYAARREQRENRSKKKEKTESHNAQSQIRLPKGSVLSFSESPKNLKREELREALTNLGLEVAYIEYTLGETTGLVRFSKDNMAKEFLEKHPEAKVKVGDSEIVFKLVEGEEEEEYLKKTVIDIAQRRKNSKFNKFKPGKGKHFKGRQGNKRKQKEHDDAPPEKVKPDS